MELRNGRRWPENAGFGMGEGNRFGKKEMNRSTLYLRVHSMFSTWDLQKIIDSSIKATLQLKIQEELTMLGCRDISVVCLADHVHTRFRQNHLRTVPETMKQMKGSTSTWINQEGLTEEKFCWAKGYEAMSIGPEDIRVIDNIMGNQENIHKEMGYEQEVKLLKAWYLTGRISKELIRESPGSM